MAVLRTLLLRLFGRALTCELCGREIARVLPLVRGGQVQLIGIENAVVRPHWDDVDRLAFIHVDVDRCRT